MVGKTIARLSAMAAKGPFVCMISSLNAKCHPPQSRHERIGLLRNERPEKMRSQRNCLPLALCYTFAHEKFGTFPAHGQLWESYTFMGMLGRAPCCRTVEICVAGE